MELLIQSMFVGLMIGVMVMSIFLVQTISAKKKLAKELLSPLSKSGLKRKNIVYKVTDLLRDDGTLWQQWELTAKQYDGSYRNIEISSYDETGRRRVGHEIWELAAFNEKIQEKNGWKPKTK